jgi:cytochrome c oxidase subunit 2
VFAIVVVLVVAFALRYRRRSDRAVSERHEANAIEGLYAVALACIAAFLVFETFRHESRIDHYTPRPTLDVRVTAARWHWRFDYPRYGVSQLGSDSIPPLLMVPAGATVRFRMTSIDVIHSFWIPDLRFKRDAFPDRWTIFELSFPQRPGFEAGNGLCGEFCGLRHGDMRFGVEIMSASQFAAWAQQLRRAGGTA